MAGNGNWKSPAQAQTEWIESIFNGVAPTAVNTAGEKKYWTAGRIIRAQEWIAGYARAGERCMRVGVRCISAEDFWQWCGSVPEKYELEVHRKQSAAVMERRHFLLFFPVMDVSGSRDSEVYKLRIHIFTTTLGMRLAHPDFPASTLEDIISVANELSTT